MLIHRLTRLVGVIPIDVSCLGLVSAIFKEICEEGKIGKHSSADKSTD